MQNLIKLSNECSFGESSQENCDIFTDNSLQTNNEKCCKIDHISKYTEEQKNSILNYYKN
jgi:hypothetical protein